MTDGVAFDPALITAAILAGGEGRRVDGQDKGLLPVSGAALIAHVSSALREQATTILICANRHIAEYSRFGSVVPDIQQGFRGPLAGITAALERCITPWLLTVPVDAPRPPHDLGLRLHAATSAARSSLAVANVNGRREPLFALYRRELAASAAEALAQDLAVWRWQLQCAAAMVDFSSESDAFCNLNTRADFARWEQGQNG